MILFGREREGGWWGGGEGWWELHDEKSNINMAVR